MKLSLYFLRTLLTFDCLITDYYPTTVIQKTTFAINRFKIVQHMNISNAFFHYKKSRMYIIIKTLLNENYNMRIIK